VALFPEDLVSMIFSGVIPILIGFALHYLKVISDTLVKLREAIAIAMTRIEHIDLVKHQHEKRITELEKNQIRFLRD